MGGKPEWTLLQDQREVEFNSQTGVGDTICLGKMGQARLIVQQKKLPAKVWSKSWKRMKDHSYFFEPKRFRFHLHFRHLESEIGKRTGSHEYFSWFIFNSALNKWNVVVEIPYFSSDWYLFKVWPPPMITHLIENQLIEGEQILGACPSLQRIRQGNDPLPSFQYLSFRTTHGPRHYLFAQTICPPVLLG